MGWNVYLILFLILCKEVLGKSKGYNGNFQSLLYVYHYKGSNVKPTFLVRERLPMNTYIR